MKLNSRESLDTGSKLIREFGSWAAVRAHSKPNKNGVLVLQVVDEERDARLQAKDRAARTR